MENFSVLEFFGSLASPREAKYFVRPDLCAYGLEDPGGQGERLRKGLVLAATYPEILEVNNRCDGAHPHLQVRGSAVGPSGGLVKRSVSSAAYPLELGLVWGRRIASACSRLAVESGPMWARRELERIAQTQKEAEERRSKLTNEVYVRTDPGSWRCRNTLGETAAVFAEDKGLAPSARPLGPGSDRVDDVVSVAEEVSPSTLEGKRVEAPARVTVRRATALDGPTQGRGPRRAGGSRGVLYPGEKGRSRLPRSEFRRIQS